MNGLSGVRLLEATAELCRLFAQDASEKANIKAVELLKRYFSAEGAALFYANGLGEHRFCLAGAQFPFALPADRWEASLGPAHEGKMRFGPWAIPGFGDRLAHWISAVLYSSESVLGYVLLGKSPSPWTDTEELSLSAIADTIAPIVGVRIGREMEEAVRRGAEERLAESERRLRSFFEDSRDMIYTADSDDRISSINSAGIALTGRADKSDLIGQPFSSLALNAQDREFFLRRIKSEGYVEDYEIVLVRGDGSTLFCLETAHTRRGEDGAVLEVQGIVKDISERIKSEGELWKTNLELAEANLKLQRTQSLMVQQEKLASMGQLAAGIAHEINNPVGFLKSNNSMLEKYLAGFRAAWAEARAAGGEAVEAIEAKAGLAKLFAESESIFRESAEGFARIISIIGNLKKFSRIDKPEEISPFDVNGGIESSLAVAWNELKYVAEVKKDYGALPQILANGGEINQVFLNIFVNAAQAIESQGRAGKGMIEISTALEGDRVRVVVRDDGPGIPASIQTRIFDPFFTTKEPGKGTGLGLSISYDIVVAKHGGRLILESEAGQGATFIVELPVAGPPSPRAEGGDR